MVSADGTDRFIKMYLVPRFGIGIARVEVRVTFAARINAHATIPLVRICEVKTMEIAQQFPKEVRLAAKGTRASTYLVDLSDHFIIGCFMVGG